MRQKERTREALVSATRELLRQGATPSVEQAADAAGMSRTTAYRYFASQAALLAATFPQLESGSLLGDDPPADVRERLALFARADDGADPAQRVGDARDAAALARPARSTCTTWRCGRGRRTQWVADALEPLRGALAAEELRATDAGDRVGGRDRGVRLAGRRRRRLAHPGRRADPVDLRGAARAGARRLERLAAADERPQALVVLTAGRAAVEVRAAARAAPHRPRVPRARARRSGRGRRSTRSQLTSGPAGPSSRPSACLRSGLSITCLLQPSVERRARVGEPPPQLAARVVQRLVERAARRREPLGEHVDRDAVERERDEHAALMRRQALLDRLLQGLQELALLGRLVRSERAAREERPGLRLERHLPSLPGPAAQLDARLEQGELVHPGAEAARAAEVVEPRQHAHQRVGGGLARDVVERLAAQVRQHRPAAGDLEPGGAQQERVQPRDRLVANGPVGAQRAQPFARVVVEQTSRRREDELLGSGFHRRTDSSEPDDGHAASPPPSSGATIRSASSDRSRARRARAGHGRRIPGRARPARRAAGGSRPGRAVYDAMQRLRPGRPVLSDRASCLFRVAREPNLTSGSRRRLRRRTASAPGRRARTRARSRSRPTPNAGTNRASARCRCGRVSVRPKPVDTIAIETAVKSAKRMSATIPIAWLRIEASRRTPTPPLPPIPCTRPIANACRGRPRRRHAEVRMVVRERAAAPADEQPERERRDHEPDRDLGALLDPGRQERLPEHDRHAEDEQRGRVPEPPRKPEPGGAAAPVCDQGRDRDEVIGVARVPQPEDDGDRDHGDQRGAVGELHDPGIEAEHV